MTFLGITWNPNESLLDLGFFQLRYYSLMFVIAFAAGWYIMKRIFVNEKKPVEILDSLFVYVVVATLVGARLGHVFFYQPELLTDDPLSVFLPIRTKPDFAFTGFSGLASHGATIGILIALYLFIKKFKNIKLMWLLDRITIPVAFGAIFVRLGNFFNSEIIGKPTDASLFSAVRFIRGEDSLTKYDAARITGEKNFSKAFDLIETDPRFTETLNSIPYRHPAQLYEAFGYLIVFVLLWWLYWKTNKKDQPGYLFGLFFVLLWTVRFVVEFVKESQGGFESALGLLSTGQWLSIPFILLGFYFMWKAKPTA